MKFTKKGAEGVKIAYVGGGSRGWAWGLMSDLVSCDDISGEVRLYDIDEQAAKNNETIGNLYNNVEGARSHWSYRAYPSLEEALNGADFVVISILPGTFDEMESDVHTPEKYGIYQSVGDTSGPGGIIRALRLLPMIEVIAKAIEANCPNAWVINYTNPMTMTVRMLYKTFPKIKAFGCCHEVFGTQKLLAKMLTDMYGIENISRDEIKVNVTGINHFTWLTSAQYKNIDLIPLYSKFVDQYYETGYIKGKDENWMNNSFNSSQRVKFDLFRRYGYIAAAGDRHLAEFCDGKWYLSSPEQAREWGFGLTPVSWRKQDLLNRLEHSRRRCAGEELKIAQTGENGVKQIRSILGLDTLVTNVNMPNVGQIPNLPLGAVVETNAVFCACSVTPVMAGELPMNIYPLISRIVAAQELVVEAVVQRDIEKAFVAFSNDSLVTVDIRSAILAGTAPDLSLFLSGDMPVNLALRDAVVDLTEFDTYSKVAERFLEHSITPFRYKNGVYALPISESFNMMFVRTDIFEELELEIPNTWEEFYEASTILQRNNLEVGIPSNIGMYATLVLQNGGTFYNESLNKTAFDNEAAIEAFKTWTGLFSRYGFPLAYDFYNRFSAGEMPMAIASYTEYLRIKVASPELSGRWQMCLIPGVLKEDGTIDRSLSISTATGGDTSPGLAQAITSTVIFSNSEKKEEAWKFIDWFTSDEIQSRFGREIEDNLGQISRYTSANLNAFKSLPWSIDERTLLVEQRQWIKSLNEISGNYSVTRELISAFRKVVYDNANPTETIYTYNKKINKELDRKN